MNEKEYALGFKVYSEDGKTIGYLTGHNHICTLEGCTGLRLRVMWPGEGKPAKCGGGNKPKYTWCCTKGMILRKNSWRIG